MNERQLWSTRIKPAWHQPLKEWVAWKVQDHAFKGLPDALLNAKGRVALVEVKYHPILAHEAKNLFVEPSHQTSGKGLSAEQRNHLQEWQNAGGWAYGFFVVFRTGFLISLEAIPPGGMTLNFMGEVASATCNGYAEFDHVMLHLEDR